MSELITAPPAAAEREPNGQASLPELQAAAAQAQRARAYAEAVALCTQALNLVGGDAPETDGASPAMLAAWVELLDRRADCNFRLGAYQDSATDLAALARLAEASGND